MADSPSLFHYTAADISRSRRLLSVPVNMLEVISSLQPEVFKESPPKVNKPVVIEPQKKYSSAETFELIYEVKPTSNSQLRQRLYSLRQKGLKAIRIEKEFHYLGSSIIKFINNNEE